MNDLNGFTESDLIRYRDSDYQIIFDPAFNEFQVKDKSIGMILAIDFDEWSDALAYLLEDVQVI
jgi:hypothetical protein